MFGQQDEGFAPRRTSFSEQESACYGQLFHAAGPDSTGAVSGEVAADFLRRSGLPEPLLRQIWELADPGREGRLPPQRFSLAMRLVAHAQAGQAPSAALTAVEAPRPPEFASPEPQAGPPDSGVSSQWDDTSCSSASSRSVRPIRWGPSERELRKYASLFLRTDGDGDGFVEADEAKALCDRSGLDESTLALAWRHADQDRDGRLTFREFVTLVHCVSCCRDGLELPPAERGQPPGLRAAVAALTQTPEELHRRRSRSSSRSAASSRSASPAPPPVRPAPPWAAALPAPAAEGRRRVQPPATLLESGFEKEVPRQRNHRYEDKLGIAGVAQDDLPERPKSRTAAAAAPEPGSPGSPSFGGERLRGEAPPAADFKAVARHLGAVAGADRLVAQRVAREAEALAVLVRNAREACLEAKPQLLRERDEEKRLGDLLRQLKLQLSHARQRLAGLQEERKGLGSESARSHHRKHFEEMHAFMKQTLEEEERVVEEARHANRRLEQSCAGLAEDLAALDLRRRELAEELRREAEGRREDERELAGLRAGRGRGAAEEDQLHHIVQDASPLVPEASPQLSSRHSEPGWASSLVGGQIFAPPARSTGPWPGTGDLHARAGV